MKIFLNEIKISTRSRTDLLDITNYVEDYVHKSTVGSGLCLVFTSHSTAAIIVNEHESGLMHDFLNKVEEIFPRGVGWLHDRVDDNAHAHLASMFIGSSRVFPVKDGRLIRGTWQNIFLLELDGPRNRSVLVEVLGE